MESLVMRELFGGIYEGKTVLLTGHTGFKGAWMALWLKELGANVVGFSLPEAPSDPWHLQQLNLDIITVQGDIRKLDELNAAFADHQPDIVFHLAAQSLVRLSYREPIETYETNVMGTINVMEAARHCGSVRAMVNITSDKAYENKEWPWGYRETDPMGGYDPYSSSKGAAELVAASYRNSFLNEAGILMATARAGNVIGGGDWAEDRIIPDIFRATGKGQSVPIRNPKAVRPWQHVLEPLSGYLQLGQLLLQGDQSAAEAWNFGPESESTITVMALTELAKQHWQNVNPELAVDPNALHEARLLKLDWSKAQLLLGWKPVWNINQTVEMTTAWFRDYFANGSQLAQGRSLADLQQYVRDAQQHGVPWAQSSVLT